MTDPLMVADDRITVGVPPEQAAAAARVVARMCPDDCAATLRALGLTDTETQTQETGDRE